jgi:hypothetical protein
MDDIHHSNWRTVVETRVAGISFENRDGSSRQALASAVAVGTRLVLCREPLNPFDEWAIALMVSTPELAGQLGYVPKAFAAVLAPLMDQGIPFEACVLRKGRVRRYDSLPSTRRRPFEIIGVRMAILSTATGLPFTVYTGMEPALRDAIANDDPECDPGDAPVLGGWRAIHELSQECPKP